jgi:hypothetical protein
MARGGRLPGNFGGQESGAAKNQDAHVATLRR